MYDRRQPKLPQGVWLLKDGLQGDALEGGPRGEKDVP